MTRPKTVDDVRAVADAEKTVLSFRRQLAKSPSYANARAIQMSERLRDDLVADLRGSFTLIEGTRE